MRVKVFAPATVANLGPGFDVFGLALKGLGDVVEVEPSQDGIIVEVEGTGPVPSDERNCAAVAAKTVLSRLGLDFGFKMKIKKGVPLSCGLGGSGASSAAGAYAMALLAASQTKKKAGLKDVILAAGEGERSVAGAFHLDNVAPSVLGGFVVISGETFVRFSPPGNMLVVLVRPLLKSSVNGKTKKARGVLPEKIELEKFVKQLGYASILLSGFAKKDVGLIGKGINDVIIEPARAFLIPGFYNIKKEAMAAGAYGASIAGAGPSVFAVCDSRKKAARIAKSMSDAFDAAGSKSESFILKPDEKGVRRL